MTQTRSQPKPPGEMPNPDPLCGCHRDPTALAAGKPCTLHAALSEWIRHWTARYERRCDCSGCWCCPGNEAGCTCDVDWDEVRNDLGN